MMGRPSWYFVSFVVYAVDLPKSGAVFFQNAAIHHNEDSGLAGFLRRFLVNDSLLHPDHGYLQADRLVHNLFHEFRPAEDVDNVNFLPDFKQRSVRLFAQRAVDLRIDRNDAINVRLHIG